LKKELPVVDISTAVVVVVDISIVDIDSPGGLGWI
jgi:hypothetical protein